MQHKEITSMWGRLPNHDVHICVIKPSYVIQDHVFRVRMARVEYYVCVCTAGVIQHSNSSVASYQKGLTTIH